MPKRRRSSGDGSIYQDKNGRWRASIDLGYINGKRRRKQLSGKTRQQVAAKLKAALKAQEAGMNLATETQTVGGFLSRWLDTVVVPTRKPTTVSSYRMLVRRYIEPKIGAIRLDKLTAEQVQAMLNALRVEGLSPRTVQYVRSTFRAALEQAIKWGYIARNVAAATEPPRGVTPKMKALNQQQAQLLLDAAKGHRLEALYRVALSYGLRRGEVLGLLWEDVDLNKGVMRITGQVQTIDNKTIRTESPKTEGSIRELPLPGILIEVLQDHQKLQELERSTVGVEWHEHGLVFPSNRGTPIVPRNLLRHFKRLLRVANLPETTRFHDLRHSAASIMLAQGVPLKTVSDILGHSDIRTTANTNGHTDDTQKRAAANTIAGLFAPVDKEINKEADQDETEV
jgi:integrase